MSNHDVSAAERRRRQLALIASPNRYGRAALEIAETINEHELEEDTGIPVEPDRASLRLPADMRRTH